MGITVYLITMFIFISVAAFAFGVWLYFRQQKEEVRLRLGRIASYGAGPHPEGAAGARSGLVRSAQRRPGRSSILGRLVGIFSKATSGNSMEYRQRRARGKMALLGARFSLALVLALVAVGFSLMTGVKSFESTMLVIGGFLVGFLIPGAMEAHKKSAREIAIRKALPDMLDLLTMSVEAGLGFDRALAKVIEGKTGPLVDEFEIVLQEIRVGRARREALRDLGERVKMPEVSRLIGAIIQAEQLGMGIAKSLRIQSEQLRLARRQRAEESAMKAPIKMLFPLILFIFPALFVVLLGPAIIQLFTMFVRMGG